MNSNKAPIPFSLRLVHQPAFFRALDKPHDGIVTGLKELGELGDIGPATASVTRHSQEELMLLRRDSAGPGGTLAKAEKTPDAIAKRGQPPQSLGAGGRNASKLC